MVIVRYQESDKFQIKMNFYVSGKEKDIMGHGYYTVFGYGILLNNEDVKKVFRVLENRELDRKRKDTDDRTNTRDKLLQKYECEEDYEENFKEYAERVRKLLVIKYLRANRIAPRDYNKYEGLFKEDCIAPDDQSDFVNTYEKVQSFIEQEYDLEVHYEEDNPYEMLIVTHNSICYDARVGKSDCLGDAEEVNTLFVSMQDGSEQLHTLMDACNLEKECKYRIMAYQAS